jgi:hypothetical protein
MNAPSLSCRFAIAPIRTDYRWGRDRKSVKVTPSAGIEKNFAIFKGCGEKFGGGNTVIASKAEQSIAQ